MIVAMALLLIGCDAASAPADGGQAAARTPQARAAAPATAGSLEAFWTRFRRAALAGDAAEIRALSAPVVVRHGSLDDSPTAKVPSARVPAAVATIMGLPDGVDPAGRVHRAILQATPTPRRDPRQPATYHRFGDLVFERGGQGWRLTEIYVED